MTCSLTPAMMKLSTYVKRCLMYIYMLYFLRIEIHCTTMYVSIILLVPHCRCWHQLHSAAAALLLLYDHSMRQWRVKSFQPICTIIEYSHCSCHLLTLFNTYHNNDITIALCFIDFTRKINVPRYVIDALWFLVTLYLWMHLFKKCIIWINDECYDI